jgi:hypothetical protein
LASVSNPRIACFVRFVRPSRRRFRPFTLPARRDRRPPPRRGSYTRPEHAFEAEFLHQVGGSVLVELQQLPDLLELFDQLAVRIPRDDRRLRADLQLPYSSISARVVLLSIARAFASVYARYSSLDRSSSASRFAVS